MRKIDFSSHIHPSHLLTPTLLSSLLVIKWIFCYTISTKKKKKTLIKSNKKEIHGKINCLRGKIEEKQQSVKSKNCINQTNKTNTH